MVLPYIRVTSCFGLVIINTWFGMFQSRFRIPYLWDCFMIIRINSITDLFCMSLSVHARCCTDRLLLCWVKTHHGLLASNTPPSGGALEFRFGRRRKMKSIGKKRKKREGEEKKEQQREGSDRGRERGGGG